MKLLVTGGAGYIGGVVVHQLVAAGHEVTVIDDLSSGYADVVPAGVEFHQMDVHDVAKVLTPDAGFDGVLHFAAKIEVGESVKYPERFWDTNVRGTLTLLDAVRAARVPRFIFSSTGSMYRATAEPSTEETEVAPQNPYAATKLMVDLMLAGEAAGHGLGAVTLRYFNAAGAVGHLGERHDPESHLIPIVLQVAAGKRDKLALYGDDYDTPDGTCVRDYIHVEDLASAHLLALDAIKPGRHEIYNLGNGNGFSNLEVIEAVRAVTGHPVPVELQARRPGDVVVGISSSAKARRELGWEPRRPDLHDIIRSAWEFYSARLG
ncbi:UDP-glucose 4-epimerase GalE [Longispora fulva]|uniref:UDP-glucose 4-epimerase n=1 Tax=Longispora fulva TaxID=619741 RepID=A0A8J7KM95_9ACTN|nr:UDP-glucose 4-epimerase GalE [Longispora fulva]MBG6140209.1 UDP-glucose 4-epimerase [Longispora fulva]GIG57414.1 UDP-glucose 4-epimerase GalE [Longispora fulva]